MSINDQQLTCTNAACGFQKLPQGVHTIEWQQKKYPGQFKIYTGKKLWDGKDYEDSQGYRDI